MQFPCPPLWSHPILQDYRKIALKRISGYLNIRAAVFSSTSTILSDTTLISCSIDDRKKIRHDLNRRSRKIIGDACHCLRCYEDEMRRMVEKTTEAMLASDFRFPIEIPRRTLLAGVFFYFILSRNVLISVA